jgi:plastocyanin
MLDRRRLPFALGALATALAPLPGVAQAARGHDPRRALRRATASASAGVVKKLVASRQETMAARALVVTIAPRSPAAGQLVELRVSGPPAGSATYRWDLDGSQRFATDTGTAPRVAHTYAKPGVDTVAVRIATGSSSTVARLTFTMRASARRSVETARKGASARRSLETAREIQAKRATQAALARPSVRAHAAADPAVGIVDFNFTPRSTTVHVGDAVTWTNNGQAPHTATANDGSFETGTLQKGASASHTFTTPGTFAYICKIHPFMKGTVTVLAAASSTGSRGSGSGASANSGSNNSANAGSGAGNGTSSSSGSTLPNTGLDALARMFGGLVLLGVGLGLRRLCAQA